MPAPIWTIGHSTRSLGEFIDLLAEHGINCLADVRTLPGSRRLPHFDREVLEPALRTRAIEYRHLQRLGGLRKPLPDSTNLGWHNPSFRGYADYMQTPAWQEGLVELLDLAVSRRVAMMCAEAVPWRCHRSLIGDALTIRGFQVLDIVGNGPARTHTLTPFARVEGEQLTYPPP